MRKRVGGGGGRETERERGKERDVARAVRRDKRTVRARARERRKTREVYGKFVHEPPASSSSSRHSRLAHAAHSSFAAKASRDSGARPYDESATPRDGGKTKKTYIYIYVYIYLLSDGEETIGKGGREVEVDGREREVAKKT